jgi:hypothetical protein
LTNLHTVVAVRVTKKLLKSAPIQHFLDHHLASAVLCNADALLDDVGTELLHRQGTDVAGELTNDTVTEPVVIQIKDVLHDLKLMS